MSRETIDFGIDLGTINSSIAVLKGTQTEVFDNNAGQKVTPSAVWLDTRGGMHVGQLAKDRLESEPDNAHAEFKLQMGTTQTYTFARSQRSMKPEELSAEVIRALRGDVARRTGEEVKAAVITVPAAFDRPENEATERGDRLAGLSYSVLIQEPTAAALAYGFQSKSDGVFWMTYDMGGGTFDAAIVQVRDGLIEVVHRGHGGDKHLGGKEIDWKIVDEWLVLKLKRDYALATFLRGNGDWRGAFGKLKGEAERAKISLSEELSTPIPIERLCQDERGRWVTEDYELRCSDIEPFIEPLVEKTITHCQRILAEARLNPGDIEKLILVGGPTDTPLLRQMVSSRLGIPLEYSVDPLTVVARGAAVFAGTQRIPRGVIAGARPAPGVYSIELDYHPIGSELEPLVGGQVVAPSGEAVSDFTIEFVESRSQWRSGRIALAANGAFMTNLRAEAGRANEFLIELRDGSGNQRAAALDRFAYTVGMVDADPPLPHTIGVGLASNRMLQFFAKGTRLPAPRRREILRTTAHLSAGQASSQVRIPVLEGDNEKRANRNREIGAIEIRGDEVRRDVPMGSEVEVAISLNQSGRLSVSAYMPILDEEFELKVVEDKPAPDRQKMASQFEGAKTRLEKARRDAVEMADVRARELLLRIDREQMLREIEGLLVVAPADRDAADKCQYRLSALEVAIDDVEDALEWPLLVAKARREIEIERKIVGEHGDGDEKKAFATLERGIEGAIELGDAELLQRKVAEMDHLGFVIAARRPEQWVGWFYYLESENEKGRLRDRSLAERLIVDGHRAINNGDLDGLQSLVRQLAGLHDDPDKVPPGILSDVDLDRRAF